MNVRIPLAALLTLCLLALTATAALADDADAPKADKVALADGKITFNVPQSWEKKKPSSNIVEHEFAAPATNDQLAAGRVTLMGAGGSVQANIDRWKKQFVKAEAEALKVSETKIDGQTVHLVDFTGDYNDARGPFVPGVVRENYRMLAAIVVTDKLGQYFIKAYGPKETIDAHEKAFHEMIKSLEVK